ncbi:MAG: GNAT family N-acetyltransferase [Pseudomonadales bacterium]
MNTPGLVTLANEFVTLSPLALSEAQSYLEIGQDAVIWRYLTPEPFQNADDAERWIAAMLARAQTAGDVPFSIYDNASGRLAGSSSYLDVRPEHGGLEIGFTWYGTAFQRSYVNTAAKLALFAEAFERLQANRVQLQTDERNEASQRAIERLGATREGVLRKHKQYPDGYVRNSVMYSVIADEWPVVKQRLQGFLYQRR